MKRLIVSIITSLALIVNFAVPVLADTTQDVTVTATPAFVGISNNPTSYNFGVVATSTNYSTTTGYFTVTNTSSVSTNVTISTNATSWYGGAGWTHSDTGTPGADTAALVSSNNTGTFNVIVKNAAPNKINSNVAANTNWQWELRLETPTSYSDGVQKSITVRLTATAA